jgi:isoquinoline 1-oxidoreductase subunit beta
MGGSFGRKAYFDYVLEAIHLSRQVNAPVKVTWTREDDIQQGPFRPGMLNSPRGGLDADGKLIVLEHKAIGGSIQGQTNSMDFSKQPDEWMGEAIKEEDSPYAVPNRRTATVVVQTDIPIVWWRSVYCSTNAFGHECFVDELAHAAKKDPLAFRLELLHEAPRFANLPRFLSEKAKYKLKPTPNQATGIAIAFSFGSIAAYAVTVSKAGKGVKIRKITGVIDCGMTVNPDNVKAQTEDIAGLALYLASDASAYTTGGVFSVDGGYVV